MSPSKWADRAGFDTSVIYDYLNGRSKPRPETRKAMAEALGVTAIELPE
jgi:transcriptional regulator with XRE-family HTH domain